MNLNVLFSAKNWLNINCLPASRNGFETIYSFSPLKDSSKYLRDIHKSVNHQSSNISDTY
jgi:hypothetical protein